MPALVAARGPRARRARLLLLPLLLLGTGLHARALGAQAVRAFVGYETPFTPDQAGAATPPLARRAVVVLVDGLGMDVSRGLPFLDALRARGADYELRIGLPSLSLPARAVLMSGAWHDVHGQISNYRPRPLRVPHLFGVLRAAGRTTALSASHNVHRLFQPSVEVAEVFPADLETASFDHYARRQEAQVAAALRVLQQRPDLALVEIYLLDEAGHGWGAASPEYARALALADDALRALSAAVDPAEAVLVVTGDHGHVPRGGHGGGEDGVVRVPLVMAGAGVRAGTRGTATQADVAPTLAALLGAPVPAANQGRPLVEALDVVGVPRRDLLHEVLAQREALTAHYLARIGVSAAEAGLSPPPPTAGSEADAVARMDALSVATGAGRAHRLRREAPGRTARAAIPPLLLVGAVWVAARGWGAPGRAVARAILFGLCAAGVYYVSLPALDLQYSLSAVNKDEWTAAFFRRDMILGAACATTAALVAGLAGRARSRADRAVAAWIAGAAFAAALAVKMAVVRAGYDILMGWQVPDQWWTFGLYLDALALTAAAPAALAAGALVLLVPVAPSAAVRGEEEPAA